MPYEVLKLMLLSEKSFVTFPFSLWKNTTDEKKEIDLTKTGCENKYN